MSEVTGNRRRSIMLLLLMSLVGVGLGVWLFQIGEVLLGCVYLGVWFWATQRSALWLLVPGAAPLETHRAWSLWQRLLLAILCLLAAAICAVGAYLWYSWPEEWQAGLVFILFGFIVLLPVTVTEIRLRKKLRAG